MNDSQKNVLRQEVQEAIQRGWRLIPLIGKEPPRWSRGWGTWPATTLEEALDWVDRGLNIGVRTGSVSGIFVVDDDTETQCAAEKLTLTPCPTAITGSGGHHYYYRAPAFHLSSSVSKLMEKVDTRGDGGYIILSGSLHPDTGEPYHWEEMKSFEDIDLPDLPEHISMRLKAANTRKRKGSAGRGICPPRSAQAYLEAAVHELRTAKEGTRNNTLNEVAFRVADLVRRERLERDTVEEALMDAALEAGLDEEESERTIASGLGAGLKAKHAYQRTDTGNANLLVDMYGHVIRHCGEMDCWYIWNGNHWEVDHRNRLQAYAKDVATELLDRNRASEDDGTAALNWAKRSANATGLTGTVNAARDLVPVSLDEFDQHPGLFNVANGTIDLLNGELRPHRQEDMLTKMSPVEFDPEAKCPRWDTFLRQIMPDDEVRAFLQRAAGSSLHGAVKDHAFFFCQGKGRNGKTTFLNTLQAAFGYEYAIQVAPSLLFKKKWEEHSTVLYDLKGVRLAICSEIGKGRALNEELLKRLAGGERIRARQMRQDNKEFTPTHSLWAGANTFPETSYADDAIWRRIKRIPFDVCIPEEECDTDLPQKLRKDLPGILNWATQGYLAWQEAGLDAPEAVNASSAACRLEMDTLGRFMSEHIEEKTGARLPFSRLYSVYEAWCEDEGIDPEPRNHFGQNLVKRGYEKRKVHGNPVYLGISLIPGGRGGSTSPCLPVEFELEEVTGFLSPTSPSSSPLPPWMEDPFADPDPYGEGSSPSAA